MRRTAYKPRACKVCRGEFVPARMGQQACGPTCAIELVRAQRERQERREHTKARAEARQRLKTLPDYIREAQAAFNGFIRRRDAGLPCISCGATPASGSCGGDFDAGHYRSRGAAPHLRFDERNCNAQCKRCNRYLSGNVVAYRAGLVARIGDEAVCALEADNGVRKWSKDELIEIRREYMRRRRELEKGRTDGRN